MMNGESCVKNCPNCDYSRISDNMKKMDGDECIIIEVFCILYNEFFSDDEIYEECSEFLSYDIIGHDDGTCTTMV